MLLAEQHKIPLLIPIAKLLPSTGAGKLLFLYL